MITPWTEVQKDSEFYRHQLSAHSVFCLHSQVYKWIKKEDQKTRRCSEHRVEPSEEKRLLSSSLSSLCGSWPWTRDDLEDKWKTPLPSGGRAPPESLVPPKVSSSQREFCLATVAPHSLDSRTNRLISRDIMKAPTESMFCCRDAPFLHQCLACSLGRTVKRKTELQNKIPKSGQF